MAAKLANKQKQQRPRPEAGPGGLAALHGNDLSLPRLPRRSSRSSWRENPGGWIQGLGPQTQDKGDTLL